MIVFSRTSSQTLPCCLKLNQRLGNRCYDHNIRCLPECSCAVEYFGLPELSSILITGERRTHASGARKEGNKSETHSEQILTLPGGR